MLSWYPWPWRVRGNQRKRRKDRQQPKRHKKHGENYHMQIQNLLKISSFQRSVNQQEELTRSRFKVWYKKFSGDTNTIWNQRCIDTYLSQSTTCFNYGAFWMSSEIFLFKLYVLRREKDGLQRICVPYSLMVQKSGEYDGQALLVKLTKRVELSSLLWFLFTFMVDFEETAMSAVTSVLEHHKCR